MSYAISAHFCTIFLALIYIYIVIFIWVWGYCVLQLTAIGVMQMIYSVEVFRSPVMYFTLDGIKLISKYIQIPTRHVKHLLCFIYRICYNDYILSFFKTCKLSKSFDLGKWLNASSFYNCNLYVNLSFLCHHNTKALSIVCLSYRITLGRKVLGLNSCTHV